MRCPAGEENILAVSDAPLPTPPAGPFTDQGKLFRSNEIGVQNSIDPFYIEENGEKYLFWGSFRGIYYIELSEDGLHIRPGAKPTQIAGTAYEAVYVHKKGKYYLSVRFHRFMLSGRKKYLHHGRRQVGKPVRPLHGQNGNSMLDNHHEVVIHPNASFAGTGHNAEIMTDKKGDDWILYHAYIRDKAKQGRVVMLDRIHWKKGWPYVEGNMPSNEAQAPKF